MALVLLLLRFADARKSNLIDRYHIVGKSVPPQRSRPSAGNRSVYPTRAFPVTRPEKKKNTFPLVSRIQDGEKITIQNCPTQGTSRWYRPVAWMAVVVRGSPPPLQDVSQDMSGGTDDTVQMRPSFMS
jgi:hypothetical protein